MEGETVNSPREFFRRPHIRISFLERFYLEKVLYEEDARIDRPATYQHRVQIN